MWSRWQSWGSDHRIGMKNEELEQILARIRHLKPELVENFGVEKIGVFGSFSAGSQHQGSDIDLIVEIKRPFSLIKLARMERFLSDRLGRPVDLVTPQGLKSFMRETVLEEVKYA